MIDLNKEKRFPIKIDAIKATEIFNKAIKNKRYSKKIKKEDVYLTITPYWFCFFDVVYNKNDNLVRISEQIAINAINNRINEDVTRLFKYYKPRVIEKLNVPKTEKTQINIKEPIISKEEAKESIQKYIIQKYNVKKESISLSGFERIFVPTWKVRFNGQKIKTDCLKGKVNDFYKIKELDPTKHDLFLEMLNEIKNPKKFFNYILFILKSIFQGIFWVLKSVFKQYKIILIIILIAIIIYLVYYIL